MVLGLGLGFRTHCLHNKRFNLCETPYLRSIHNQSHRQTSSASEGNQSFSKSRRGTVPEGTPAKQAPLPTRWSATATRRKPRTQRLVPPEVENTQSPGNPPWHGRPRGRKGVRGSPGRHPTKTRAEVTTTSKKTSNRRSGQGKPHLGSPEGLRLERRNTSTTTQARRTSCKMAEADLDYLTTP